MSQYHQQQVGNSSSEWSAIPSYEDSANTMSLSQVRREKAAQHRLPSGQMNQVRQEKATQHRLPSGQMNPTKLVTNQVPKPVFRAGFQTKLVTNQVPKPVTRAGFQTGNKSQVSQKVRPQQTRVWAASPSQHPASSSLTVGTAGRPPVAVLLRSPTSRQARVRRLRNPQTSHPQQPQDQRRQPRSRLGRHVPGSLRRSRSRESPRPQLPFRTQVVSPVRVRSHSRGRPGPPPGFAHTGSKQPRPGILQTPRTILARMEQASLQGDLVAHTVPEQHSVPVLSEANTTALLKARLLALERQAFQLGLPPPSVDVVMESSASGPPRSHSAPPAAIYTHKRHRRRGSVRFEADPLHDPPKFPSHCTGRKHGVATKIPAPMREVGNTRRHSFCALPPPRSSAPGPPTPLPRSSLRPSRPVPAPRTLLNQGFIEPPGSATKNTSTSGPHLLKHLHTLVDLSPSWSTNSRNQLAVLMDILMDDPGAHSDLHKDRPPATAPSPEQQSSMPAEATPQRVPTMRAVPATKGSSSNKPAHKREPVHIDVAHHVRPPPGFSDLHTGDKSAPGREPVHISRDQSASRHPGMLDLSITFTDTGDPLFTSSRRSVLLGKPNLNNDVHTGDTFSSHRKKDHVPGNHSIKISTGLCDLSVKLMDTGVPLRSPSPCSAPAGESMCPINSHTGDHNYTDDSVPTGDVTWVFRQKPVTGHHTNSKIAPVTKPPDRRSSHDASRGSNFADVTENDSHSHDVAPPPSPEDPSSAFDKAQHHPVCIDGSHILCWERSNIVRHPTCKQKEFKSSPREPGECDNTCASGLVSHLHGGVPPAPSRLNPDAPCFIPASSTTSATQRLSSLNKNTPKKDILNASRDLTGWRPDVFKNKRRASQNRCDLLTNNHHSQNPYFANRPQPRRSSKCPTSCTATRCRSCTSESYSIKSETLRSSSHFESAGSSPSSKAAAALRRPERSFSTSRRRFSNGMETVYSNSVSSNSFSATNGYNPSNNPRTSGLRQSQLASNSAPPVPRTPPPRPVGGTVSPTRQRCSASCHSCRSAARAPGGPSLGNTGQSPQLKDLFSSFLAGFAPPSEGFLSMPRSGRDDAITNTKTGHAKLKHTLARPRNNQQSKQKSTVRPNLH